MLMERLLSNVICETFEKEAGRRALMTLPREGRKAKALRVSFKTSIDYDKEEGYRYLDLLIFAPMNYVGVVFRRRWTVIPLEDLEYDEAQDESFIKEGKDYQSGQSEWNLLGYHDSCWRDAVDRFLRDFGSEILVFDGLGSWYSVVEMEEQEAEEIASVLNSGCYYQHPKTRR